MAAADVQIWLAISILVFFSIGASTEGTNFHIVFLENVVERPQDGPLEVHVSNTHSTTAVVTVSSPRTSCPSQTLSVSPGSATYLLWPHGLIPPSLPLPISPSPLPAISPSPRPPISPSLPSPISPSPLPPISPCWGPFPKISVATSQISPLPIPYELLFNKSDSYSLTDYRLQCQIWCLLVDESCCFWLLASLQDRRCLINFACCCKFQTVTVL